MRKRRIIELSPAAIEAKQRQLIEYDAKAKMPAEKPLKLRIGFRQALARIAKKE